MGPGYQVLIPGPNGEIQDQPAPLLTMRGTVRGAPNARVAAAVSNGWIEAMILEQGQTWWITPEPTDSETAQRRHVVYEQSSIRSDLAAPCGVAETAIPSTPTEGVTCPPTEMREVEMFLDLDHNFVITGGASIGMFGNVGGGQQPTESSNGAAEQRAVALMNMVSLIYEGQVNVRIRVMGVLCQTLTQVYFAGNLGTLADMNALLAAVQANWTLRYPHVVRDLVHLFSSRGPGSGILGNAYLTVQCVPLGAPGRGYAVSRVVLPSVALNTTLVAHEIGHNLSANHCDFQPDCGIMCATIGACSLAAFGTTTEAAICAHTADPCWDPVFVAAFTPFGSGCPNGSGNTPSMVSTDRPLLGTNITITVDRVPSTSPVWLIEGTSNQTWGGIPLPYQLPNAPGCLLQVSYVQLHDPETIVSGTATWVLGIPNNPSLLGLDHHVQGLLQDLSANASGLVVSNAATVTFGDR